MPSLVTVIDLADRATSLDSLRRVSRVITFQRHSSQLRLHFHPDKVYNSAGWYDQGFISQYRFHCIFFPVHNCVLTTFFTHIFHDFEINRSVLHWLMSIQRLLF